MTCFSFINKKNWNQLLWYERRRTLWEMVLLDNIQLQEASCQAASLKPTVDYFPLTACPILYYFLDAVCEPCRSFHLFCVERKMFRSFIHKAVSSLLYKTKRWHGLRCSISVKRLQLPLMWCLMQMNHLKHSQLLSLFAPGLLSLISFFLLVLLFLHVMQFSMMLAVILHHYLSVTCLKFKQNAAAVGCFCCFYFLYFRFRF